MEIKGTIEGQFEAIYSAYRDNGYIFETNDNVPNIFVIRRGSATHKYTDLIGVALFTAESSYVKMYPATSRAAEYHFKRSDIAPEDAFIVGGQYIDLYKVGVSSGGYSTLLQSGEIDLGNAKSREVSSKGLRRGADLTTANLYHRDMLNGLSIDCMYGIAFKESLDHEDFMKAIKYCAHIAG